MNVLKKTAQPKVKTARSENRRTEGESVCTVHWRVGNASYIDTFLGTRPNMGSVQRNPGLPMSMVM